MTLINKKTNYLIEKRICLIVIYIRKKGMRKRKERKRIREEIMMIVINKLLVYDNIFITLLFSSLHYEIPLEIIVHLHFQLLQ